MTTSQTGLRTGEVARLLDVAEHRIANLVRFRLIAAPSIVAGRHPFRRDGDGVAPRSRRPGAGPGGGVRPRSRGGGASVTVAVAAPGLPEDDEVIDRTLCGCGALAAVVLTIDEDGLVVASTRCGCGSFQLVADGNAR